MINNGSRSHDNIYIPVRPDLSLEDRMKGKIALAELEIHEQNGEETL